MRVNPRVSALNLFKCFINGHPVNMFIEKHVGLGLAIYGAVDTSKCDMQLAGPPFRAKKHAAATFLAEATLCTR